MAYNFGGGYGLNGIPPPPPPAMENMVYEINVPPSPTDTHDRSGLVQYGYDERPERSRLSVHGGAVQRSSSMKDTRRSTIQVGDSRRHRDRSRPRSTYYGGGGGAGGGRHYDDDRGRDRGVYYGGGGGGGGGSYYADSDYSASSREHSRGPPPRRRSPSVYSDYGYEPYPQGPPGWPGVPPPPSVHGHPGMMPPVPPPPNAMGAMGAMIPTPQAPMGAMVPWQAQAPPHPQDELAQKINELQLELKKSKEEAEKIRIQKEQEELRKKKEEELRIAVEKKLEADRKAAEEARKAEELKKAEIEAAAAKLLEDQRKAAEAAKIAEELKRAEIEAAAAKLIEDQKKAAEAKALEEQKKAEMAAATAMMLDLRKPTHTKFSKTHLCKEALDERKISYTENVRSFHPFLSCLP